MEASAIWSLGIRARGDLAGSVGSPQNLRAVNVGTDGDVEKGTPLPNSVQGPAYESSEKAAGLGVFIKATAIQSESEGDTELAKKIAEARSYALRIPGLAGQVLAANTRLAIPAPPPAELSKLAPLLSTAIQNLIDASQKLTTLTEEISGPDAETGTLRNAVGTLEIDVRDIATHPETPVADLDINVTAVRTALGALLSSARSAGKKTKTPVFYARFGFDVLFRQAALKTALEESNASANGLRPTLFLDLGLPTSKKFSLVAGGEVHFPGGSLDTRTCPNGLCGLEADTYFVDGGTRTVPMAFQNADFSPGVAAGGNLGVEVPMGDDTAAFASVRVMVFHRGAVTLDAPAGLENYGISPYSEGTAGTRVITPAYTLLGALATISYDEVTIINNWFN